MNFVLAAGLFAWCAEPADPDRPRPAHGHQHPGRKPRRRQAGGGGRHRRRRRPTLRAIGRADRVRRRPRRIRGRADRRARDGEEIEVPIIPRSVSAEDRARGIGPVGFAYEPARAGRGAVDRHRTARRHRSRDGSGVDARHPDSRRPGRCGRRPARPEPERRRMRWARSASRRRPGACSKRRSSASSSSSASCRSTSPCSTSCPSRRSTAAGSLSSLLESARRRKLPAEREALIYLTGFAVLIALVILISIQDIQRLVTRRLTMPLPVRQSAE